MRIRFLSVLILLASASVSHAQHAGDVEFGYDSTTTPTAFVIEEVGVTSEGILYFESEFEPLDPFNPGDFSSNEPGFNTNPAEMLLVNPGDQIWLNALNASLFSSFGQGFVNYYNPTTDALEASGRLRVIDNSTGTVDLTLDGAVIESGLSNQFIDFGSSGSNPGEVHDHVILDLLDDATAPLGAYGVMFQFQSDFATGDGIMDLSSDPFWIVWNHGMSEADFENLAMPKFGAAAVPEPTAASLLALAAAGSLLRRRRKLVG